MRLRLRISSRAASEIERAERWWRQNRSAAPDTLREDLAGLFTVLPERPGIGIKVASSKLHGVRRLTLSRVRYYLYYRVLESELIVLAFWHTSRRPPRL